MSSHMRPFRGRGRRAPSSHLDPVPRISVIARSLCAVVALGGVASAQGDTCMTAQAISGIGSHAYDNTSFTVSGFVGAGPCGNGYVSEYQRDLFWEWTATTAGDYELAVDDLGLSQMDVFRSAGCGGDYAVGDYGYVYEFHLPDVQAGETFLFRLGRNDLSQPSTGTLTIATFSDACSTAVDDAFEPNDSFSTATPITPGTYSNLFVWGADHDYYSIVVPAASTLEIDITNVPFELFDTSCADVLDFVSGANQYDNETGAAQTIILQVYETPNPGNCSTYDLELRIFDDPCQVGPDDGLEENDSCQTPAAIVPGFYPELVSALVDSDFYSVSVPPYATLTVTAPYEDGIRFQRFTAACAAIGALTHFLSHTNLTGSVETVVFEARPLGYCVDYDMTVDVSAGPCLTLPDDTLEDNDTCSGGGFIGDDTYGDLFVSIFDPDFYTLCVPAGGTLDVNVNFADNLVAVDAYLRSSCGAAGTIGDLDVGIDNLDIDWTNTGGSDVQVYLEVSLRYPAILGECGSYNLTVSGTCTSVGTTYCLSTTNSTGSPSTISASGSASITAEDLELRASHAPASQTAIFFTGPDAAQMPFGDGFLCVGGTLVRLYPVSFEAAGEFVNSLDFGTYGVALGAMSTARFQCWYRDPAAGATGFNLSDGLEITWFP